MWTNPLYQIDAWPELKSLLNRNTLATLIASAPLRATHVPILVSNTPSGLVLTGHVPKQDPVANAIDRGQQVLCIFHGPRAYITPEWYTNTGLPTYNFEVVHLTGEIHSIDDQELREHLSELIAWHEDHRTDPHEQPWQMDAQAITRADTLIHKISGFKVLVNRAEAKAKLGQNRTLHERYESIAGLKSTDEEEATEVAQQMYRNIHSETNDKPDVEQQ